MRTRIVELAVVAMIGGCGGSDGGGGTGRIVTISATETTVCDDVADVACHNLFSCCSEGEIEKFLMVSDPRTEEECRDDVHTLCKRALVSRDFSLANKHVRFDPEVMNACLEAVLAPEGTCTAIDAVRPWTEACLQSAWIGIVEPGGACDFTYECTKDNFCSGSRICKPLAGDGMSCASQLCASGLYCDTTAICHPLVAAGGPCTLSSQCQKGAFCDTLAATPVCTALHAAGERCTGAATCAVGTTCLPGTCADTGFTCFSSAGCTGRCGGPTGFSCTIDSQCSSGVCSVSGASCFTQGLCPADGGTCVFPVKCVHPDCQGDVVCAEAHTEINYCTDALDQLPL